MTRTLIVTDSCSDLSYERLGDSVMVVPFLYHHESDGVERRDSVYIEDEFNCSDVMSKGVTYLDVLSKLEYAYKNNLDVILLYSSGKINRCNEATFLLALEDFKKSLPVDSKMNVFAVDSGLFSASLGLLVNDLVELEMKGYDIFALYRYIRDNKHLYNLEFISDDVDNLLDSKCSLARYFEKKNVSKSVMSVSEGKIVKSRKVSNPNLRVDDIIARFKSDVDLRHPVTVVHSDNEILATELYRTVNGFTYDLDISDTSKVVKSIMGNKSYGIAYKKKVR